MLKGCIQHNQIVLRQFPENDVSFSIGLFLVQSRTLMVLKQGSVNVGVVLITIFSFSDGYKSSVSQFEH